MEKPLRKIIVESPSEYTSIARSLRPGDVIVLKNGVWKDFDLVLEAQGTERNPIILTAETPGQVVLSGQSSLRLGGQYLIVSGLVFRDGYTPRNEVISFRRDSETLAFNSRVTNTVIENYSNPDRSKTDIWVVMYGRSNVFAHNHLAGKLNAGPTMAVRLNSEDSQKNGHRIEYNYFGPRPVFGSNGGETIRIGTSQYSLTRSETIVEHNYFDRCSGEVEIISNKSGGNIYRGNTFFESRGTLTLRHGSGTLVENNFFDGNGAPYTGGVRVINERQTVRNNYFRDLTGTRFAGGLVVMNGVPNSPLNRYNQVDGAIIENNTFERIAAIELAEGSDKERNATPVNSRFTGNIVVGSTTETPFRIHDDVSGIAFVGNLASSAPPEEIADGFEERSFGTTDSFLGPIAAAGASGAFGVERYDTGVSWYPKPSAVSPFTGGKNIRIEPGENRIADAMAKADAGDTLILSSGTYKEARRINLQIPLTIKAADDASEKPRIAFERPNLFLLSSKGALRLEGIEVSGELAPDLAGNSFIVSSSRGGGGNHVLEIVNSSFLDFTVNRGFSVVSAEKGTFFDRISVKGSDFSNITGDVFKLDAENDNAGIYNIEYLDVSDSRFEKVSSSIASVYRGGRDESTFGPHVTFSSVTMSDIGAGKEPLLELYGVQHLRLEDNSADAALPVSFTITTGKPVPQLSENMMVSGGTFLTTKDLR